MIDPEAVDLSSLEHAKRPGVRMLEHRRELHPQAGQIVDVEEAHLGRLDEARSAVKAGLALNPAFSISRARISSTVISDHPTYLAGLEPILEGLRKAGVPEQ